MMRPSGSSGFDFDRIRQGLTSCDLGSLSGFYADDAEMKVIDNTRPPTHPTTYHGKSEITGYFKDVCGRNIVEHEIDEEVVGSERLSFHETCRYDDGTQVLAANTLDLEDGKIKRHTIVQAWGK